MSDAELVLKTFDTVRGMFSLFPRNVFIHIGQSVKEGRNGAENIKREFDILASDIEAFPRAVKLSLWTTIFTSVVR